MTLRTDIATLMVVVVICAATVGTLPVIGTTAADEPTGQTNLSAGESLAGAFAAQSADLEGSVETRALDAALAQTDSETARASLLADRRLEVDRRAQSVLDQRDRLREQHRNGTLTESAYRVRAIQLAAERRQLHGLLSTVARQSQSLSDPIRDAYGLDDAALLRSKARVDVAMDAEFDAAFVAVVGEVPTLQASNATGSDVRNETEHAVRRTQTMRDEIAATIEEKANDGADDRSIACARDHLANADAALEDAVAALNGDDDVTAERAIVDARSSLRLAHECLDDGDSDGTTDGWNGGTEDPTRNSESADDGTANDWTGDREFDDGSVETSDSNRTQTVTPTDSGVNDSDF